MPILVGIDAGGTSTECAVERDGELVRVRGDAANLRRAGVEIAADRIFDVLAGALAGSEPHAIVVGAAGAGDSQLARALEERLRTRFAAARVAVREDAAIALRAGVPAGDGIVLVAGTGSIAYGIFGESVVRAGGYGALLGDEGSGFAIGRAGLSIALRAIDGRTPPDPLADSIAAALDASDAPSLIARLYGGGDPVAAAAALAPLLLERANAGERSASKIVQGAAVDLVDLVKAVVKRADAATRDLPLVLAGGLLVNNSLLSYLIETRLAADLPLLAPVKNVPAAVFGALALARQLASP